MKPPQELFNHLAGGGLVEAHNSGFEWWIWNKVCVTRYGWPPLAVGSLRCSMAKARASSYPPALKQAGAVLRLSQQKDAAGDRLLKKFSVPRNPTKKDPRLSILPDPADPDFNALVAYCLQDINTEAELSSKVPDLPPEELNYWLADQHINRRGVAVDLAAIADLTAIIEQGYERFNREIREITEGHVEQASQVSRLLEWLRGQGYYLDALDDDAVSEALKDAHGVARRALEIRQAIGSASVKKLYSMRLQATEAGRLHDLFSYHAARTGRAAGNGPQPQNLPNSGPDIAVCRCGTYRASTVSLCPKMCPPGEDRHGEWDHAAAESVLSLAAMRDFDHVAKYFPDVFAAVSGCLRGLFVASPGHEFISSDYSAIEAVVAAALAGEQWRLDIFNTHGKIYEASAAQIFNVPFEEFERHKQETKQHHPLRKKGKVAELASGYQGWIGAWKQFGADGSDEEIKSQILAWREASPAIVEMWGGQTRGKPWDTNAPREYYGLEGAAIAAVLNPGTEYRHREVSYVVRGDVLYCRIPSGRYLTYHAPRLGEGRWPGTYGLSYMGWNTNPKKGPYGWIRMATWGGQLFENAVQAVARDILRDATLRLEAAGYPIVLHVHDEVVAEVPEGFGSVQEFEQIMEVRPAWASDWPVRAGGGWRGKRFRK